MKLVFSEVRKAWRISVILQLTLLRLSSGQDIAEELLENYQYDIAKEGQTFLLNESRHSSFFLLGELHGEQEIPQLLYSLWPKMNEQGYTHIVAELSPWSAAKLEFGVAPDTLTREGLWTNKEAKLLRNRNSSIENPTLWGCDMEEMSIDLLIETLTKENPNDGKLKNLVDQLEGGYNRKIAPAILDSLRNYEPERDVKSNGISLYSSIISCFKIDSARAFPDSRLKAQTTRENIMKEYFLSRYKMLPLGDSSRFLFRFGRNHLHRGFDSRGISTLEILFQNLPSLRD